MGHDRRLRRDARRLADDPEAAALLECLAEHLFDPALDAAFLSRVCGATQAVRKRLAAKVGPLSKYVAELRMAKAASLVRETQAPIAEIGRQVGYPVVRSFRRVFSGAHGVSPSEMRRKARAQGGEAAAGTDEEPEIEAGGDAARRARARRLRRRRTLGMLDARRAEALRFELRRLHPRLDEMEHDARSSEAVAMIEPHPVLLTPTGDWLEEIAANSAFGQILDLPEDEQRFALLQGMRLGNVTAFHQLFRFSRELIQYDAERAIEVARLGVELAEPHRELMRGAGDHWQAMAWVCLARVQAHAGDFGGADQSLGFALTEVGGEEGLEPRVELELRRVEGLIRQRQRRHREAARALDRAVELGRELEVSHPERRQSVLARLELASAMGAAGAAFALIRELEELLDAVAAGGRRSTLWHAFLPFHEAKAHAAAGQPCCAERCLPASSSPSPFTSWRA